MSVPLNYFLLFFTQLVTKNAFSSLKKNYLIYKSHHVVCIFAFPIYLSNYFKALYFLISVLEEI